MVLFFVIFQEGTYPISYVFGSCVSICSFFILFLQDWGSAGTTSGWGASTAEPTAAATAAATTSGWGSSATETPAVSGGWGDSPAAAATPVATATGWGDTASADTPASATGGGWGSLPDTGSSGGGWGSDSSSAVPTTAPARSGYNGRGRGRPWVLSSQSFYLPLKKSIKNTLHLFYH